MICPACGRDLDGTIRPGLVIRQRRLELGLTMEKLADLSGVEHAVSWWSRLENERKTPPKMDELAAICRVLGLDPMSVACGKEVIVR